MISKGIFYTCVEHVEAVLLSEVEAWHPPSF